MEAQPGDINANSEAQIELRNIASERPPLGENEFKEKLKESNGADSWFSSLEHEQKLKEIRETEDFQELSQSFNDLSDFRNSVILKLARTFVRLFNMMPQRFFSLEFGLKAYMTSNPLPTDKHPFLLPRNFSEKVHQLVAHPLFSTKKNPAFFALVLQFTSICRTRSNLRWAVPLLAPEDEHACPQIKDLRNAMRIDTKRQYPYDILKKCFENESSLSDEIKLLLKISIPLAVPPRRATDTGSPIQYEVFTQDIEHIGDSINAIEPRLVTVKKAFSIWNGVSQTNYGFPTPFSINGDLLVAYEQITKSEIFQRQLIEEGLDERQRQLRMDYIILSKLSVDARAIGQLRLEAITKIFQHNIRQRYRWLFEAEFSFAIDKRMWSDIFAVHTPSHETAPEFPWVMPEWDQTAKSQSEIYNAWRHRMGLVYGGPVSDTYSTDALISHAVALTTFESVGGFLEELNLPQWYSSRTTWQQQLEYPTN